METIDRTMFPRGDSWGWRIGRAQRTFRTVKTRYDIFLMNICLYTYAKTHGMLR